MKAAKMRLAWDSKTKPERSRYVRKRSDDPYHSWRWTRLSRAFRAEHPLCEECRRRGIIKAATVVDHVVPWPVCEDFFDRSNLQSLCEACNHDKGQRDKVIIRQWRKSHPDNK